MADNTCAMQDRDLAMANTGEPESTEGVVIAKSNDSVSDQDLIRLLSFEDVYDSEPLCDDHWIKWCSRTITIKAPKVYLDRASSLGYLDKLPLELLHSIFNTLDFQSLSRVSRISLRANALVQWLPAYMDLMKHARRALAVLAATGLIRHHSAGTLRAALRSENCTSCGSFGAYLFVLTCKRCCHLCLLNNQSLWIVHQGAAALCFHIPRRQLDQIPTIHVRPGSPCYTRTVSGSTRGKTNFVSVGCAKKLALDIHGSQENIDRLVIRAQFTFDQRSLYEHYRAAPLQPYDANPFLMPNRDRRPPESVINGYVDMGDVLFPSTASGVVDYGHRCLGCKRLSTFCDSKLNQHKLDWLAPGISTLSYEFIKHMFIRQHSREEFLQHVRRCYGVRRIAAEQGLGHWLQEIAHIPIDQWKRG